MRSRYLDHDESPRGEGAAAATSAPPGPEPIDNDSWDHAQDDDSERYYGRRRAERRTARWRWVAITVVAAGLIAAVALATAPPARYDGAKPKATIPAASTVATTDEPSLSLPGSQLPSPPRVTIQSQEVPAAAQKSKTRAPTLPPFPAVTFEAEAGSPAVILSGSAQVQGYARASGGEIVSSLGNWGGGEQEPGTLQISGVDIPTTGTYRIAVYFTHPEISGSRTAVISVSGVDPVSVTFSGGHNCCGVRYLDTALEAGAHTVTISNPTDVAPSIDKIVISRP